MDQTSDFVGDFHDSIDAGSALKAGVVALLAPQALVKDLVRIFR